MEPSVVAFRDLQALVELHAEVVVGLPEEVLVALDSLPVVVPDSDSQSALELVVLATALGSAASPFSMVAVPVGMLLPWKRLQ